MWKKIIALTYILFFFMIIPSAYAQVGEAEQSSTNVVVMIVPGFSMQEAEWLWMHGDKRPLWEDAAFAAMNVRSAGPYSYLNNMVSISTGKKALGIQDWNSYEIGEEVEGTPITDLMNELKSSRADTGVMHPHLYRLQQKNLQSDYRAEVGILGQTLQEGNVKRFVWGQSDTRHEAIRYGSLFTMNRNGESDGFINAIQRNPEAAFGMEMDEEIILNGMRKQQEKKRFNVVEWGDVYRLFEQKPLMEPRKFAFEYERQLIRLESFIHNLINIDSHHVWLLAPMMNQEAYDRKEQLAPVFYWNKEVEGALSSQTTRQSNLVSNMDVVPTIISSFNLPVPDSLIGHVMDVNPLESVDKQIVFLEIEEMVSIFASRGTVLSIYITSLVVLLLGAGVGIILAKGQMLWIKLIKIILIAGWSSPFWFLILTLWFHKVGVIGFLFLLTTCSLICGYIFEKLCRQAVVLIGILLFLTITVDLFLGSPLMQRSFLGYDPIIGARYYGIGNEYAGVYLITAFACLVPVLKWARKSIVVLIIISMMSFQVVMLGKNTLGTNAGATLSAGVAYLFILYLVFKRKLSFSVILLVVLLASGFSLLLLYFLQQSGSQSHIGFGFERLLEGDFLYIIDTIQRKLAMNVKIFRHSNWTQLFITSYVLGAVILWKRRLRVEGFEERVFLQGGVVASFALLVLNDSGVVAAATSMFCVVSAHYYWVLTSYQNKVA
ncbi:hypothetical protein [Bacillus solitudinis]|uniref:hypothetical protein n=1 Tax=Bacillus solitudinis TaxID=2014074 RepID=UPI000C24D957|nr:hypothetical protein [Bacillus solitudinis]